MCTEMSGQSCGFLNLSSSSFFFSAFSPSSRRLQHIYTSAQNPRNSSNALLLASISASSLPRRRHRKSHLSPPTNTSTTTYADFGDKPNSATTSNFVNPSNLELSFEVDRVASFLKRYCNDFLSSGEDAFHDLRSSVRVRDDYGRRGIVFSCRKSSIVFVGNVLVYCTVGFIMYRVFWGVLSWFRLQWGRGNWSSSVVTKRDRSLGGKEVVVARKSNNDVFRNKEYYRRKTSPLSLGRLDEMQTRIGYDPARYKPRKERIPEWWPVSVPSSSSSGVNDGSSQIEASMLVREIVDNRMAGKDFNEYDIIRLRRICRGSNNRVKFDTENTRDSFFRASVDFILNVCIRAGRTITADHAYIDGEEVRHFLAGLSYNIGLENSRAVILLNAAVAVKTRSCFLQAWALEAQGKYLEALEELSKISYILHTFPPDDGSPEMEMVAIGLRKNLKIEQRKHLLNLFREVSSNAKIQRIASAALDLQQQQEIGFDHSKSDDTTQA